MKRRQVSIRPYSADDFPTILQIYASSKLDELQYEGRHVDLVPLDHDAKRLASFEASDVVVFELDGVIAGYCGSHGREIRSLMVLPCHRGKGIGAKLMQYMLAKIPGDLRLNVAKSNFVAQGLYCRFGFHVEREFIADYNGVPVSAITMVLQRAR